MSPKNIFQKFQKSFRFRLFIIFTLSTALITVVFSTVFILREIRSSHQEASEKARLLASLLADRIRLYLYAEDRDNLYRLAEETAQHPQVAGVTVLNSDGTVLVNIAKPKYNPSNTLNERVSVTSGTIATPPESELTNAPKRGETVLGTVRLKLDTSDHNQKIHELVIYTIITSLSFWLLVLFLSYLALQWMTRSFNSLMQGVKNIREGDYSVRIETDTDDEPGWAAVAINELAESLEQREAQNRCLQEELVNAMKLEVQEEKKRLMAQLIQTNRMTSLGLLVSSMAHEINNPNGSIRLAGQFMTKAWKDALPVLEGVAREEGNFSIGGIPFDTAREEITKSADTIVRNTDRIERVIHDLRAYSLGEGNEFRSNVNLNTVVSGALAIIRAHGRHGDIAFVVDLAHYLPPVKGNFHQLEQVVINLVLNAIQAMSERKGTVTVTTSFNRESLEVQISVQDEGEGLNSECREHLFEPFFSTRIDKGGSGLGLYISKFLVTEHMGVIELDSEPGTGTTVTVKLPPAL